MSYLQLFPSVQMEECLLLKKMDGKHLSYRCSKNILDIPFKLIIVHRFPEINTFTESLMYYISLNKDRVYNESYGSNPELLNTSKITDNLYTSTYLVPVNKYIKEIDSKKSCDEIKVNFFLPFDHQISIIDIKLYMFIK